MIKKAGATKSTAREDGQKKKEEESNQAAYSGSTVCGESWCKATLTDGRGWWKTQTLGMIRVHL